MCNLLNHRYRHVSCLLICILIAGIFFGCVKEEFDSSNLDRKFKFETGLATPVGYRTLTMNDFFKPDSQHYVSVDETGLLTLYYKNEFQSPSFENFLQPEVVTVSEALTNTSGADWNLEHFQDTIVISDTIWVIIDFQQLGQSVISEIMFDNLDMQIHWQSSFNGRYEIVLPTLTKNQRSYTTQLLSEVPQEESLIGYSLKLQQRLGNQAFPMVWTANLYSTGGVIPAGSNFASLDISMNNFEVDKLFGQFYDLSMKLPATHFDLNIYEFIPEGSFRFSNPELSISTRNTVGVPIGLGFISIEALTRENELQPIYGRGVPDTSNHWVYNHPEPESSDEIFDSLTVQVPNWNFDDVSETAPEELSFTGELKINPQNDSTTYVFANNSRTTYNLNLGIPLYGYAQFLSMADTMEFRISDFLSSDYDPVQKAFFRLYVTNEFPVSLNLQVYVADESYHIIDSLFSERQIIESEILVGENPESFKNEPVIAEITREKFELLKEQGFYLISNAHFQTAGYSQNPPKEVGIFDYHFMDIHLGLVVDLKGTADVQ